ncbi:MAG: terminase small subunit [Methanosarcinales archaeon]|jgi:phage terminase small subunit|nr:terminase small subunit [Methanosarcinales archaeon]
MMPKGDNLTPKMMKFIDEYLKTGNATDAYLAAGYRTNSRNIAGVEGSKLLRKPKVLSELERRRAAIIADSIADAVELQQFWTQTMRSGSEEKKDQLKASEFLAKTKGMFISRVEIMEAPSFVDDV